MLLQYVVCIVVLVVSCDGQLQKKSTNFRPVQWPNGTNVCALDAASSTRTATSDDACSQICKRSIPTCGNFNFDQSSGQCALYYQRPKCYGFTSSSCTGYELDSYPNKPDTGIPDTQCHIPFTYKKKLYMSCGLNLAGDGCMSCQSDNGTIVRCQQPATFVAQPIQTTISIPTFPQPVPVVSVNGWTLFLYRFDGSLPFNETWVNYRNGFGNLNAEFWLGLEKLYQLTNSGNYKVRFEYKSIQNESWFSTEYSSFKIDPESSFYAIHVSGYTGDGGGSLFEYPNAQGVQNGMSFTTWDSDNDRCPAINCVTDAGKGGWWYNCCAAHTFTNPFGTTRFYNRWLTDSGLATDSRLAGVRGMIKLA